MVLLIRSYSEICPCPTFVDCSFDLILFSSFRSNRIPLCIFILREMYEAGFQALVGHQILQEAWGCRSDSSVWPWLPPLVRHSDHSGSLNMKYGLIRNPNEWIHWIRVEKRNEKHQKERKFQTVCLWIRFAFPLPWDPFFNLFYLSPLQAPCFFLLVKKLVSPDVCCWKTRWNAAVATMRTMPLAKAIWVILAASELCSPRGP